MLRMTCLTPSLAAATLLSKLYKQLNENENIWTPQSCSPFSSSLTLSLHTSLIGLSAQDFCQQNTQAIKLLSEKAAHMELAAGCFLLFS